MQIRGRVGACQDWWSTCLGVKWIVFCGGKVIGHCGIKKSVLCG